MDGPSSYQGIYSIPYRIVVIAKAVVGISTFLALSLLVVSIYGILNAKNSITNTSQTIAVTEFTITAHKIIGEYEKLIASEGKTGMESLKNLETLNHEVLDSRNKLIALFDEGDILLQKSDEIVNLFKKIDQLGKEMVVAFLDDDKKAAAEMKKRYDLYIKEFDGLDQQALNAIQGRIVSRSDTSFRVLFGMASVAVAIFVIFLITTSVSIRRLLINVLAIIRNDKNVQNELQHELNNVSKQLDEASVGLLEASDKLSTSGDSLKIVIDESKSSVSKSHESIEEISKKVRDTASYASFSMGQATNAQSKATEGLRVVQDMSLAMGAIRESNQALNTIILMIEKIRERAKFIDDIVLQTELLSLNARVEAAHAGQHGKGFAIVASEVGNLARKSGESAKAIDSILNESTQKINESIEIIGKRIAQGEIKTKDCVALFESISDMNTKLKGSIETIDNAATDQVRSLTDVSASIEQIQGSTVKSAESADETIDQSNYVGEEAKKFKKLIETLDNLVKRDTAEGSEREVVEFIDSLHLVRFAKKLESIFNKHP